MATIFFLKGLIGSGKSTLRKEMMDAPSLQPITYTNKDEIRKQLLVVLNTPWNHRIEKKVEKIEQEQVVAACMAGLNVVIDNTHGSDKHRRRYQEVARLYGYNFQVIELSVPLEECIRRDAERGENSIGEKAIRKMYRTSFVKPYVRDKSLPRCIICDLDNTLFRSVNRGPFEFSKAYSDEVVESVKILLDAMIKSNSTDHVLFVTGRDETGKEATEKALLDKCGYDVKTDFFKLFMKKSGDQTPDTITKLNTLKNDILPYYGILFVLDDRRRIVEMWREQGIPCFEVAEKDD